MRKSSVYSWHLLLREDYLESICSPLHPNWPIYIEDYLETPLGGCFVVRTVTELLMDNLADLKLWATFGLNFQNLRCFLRSFVQLTSIKFKTHLFCFIFREYELPAVTISNSSSTDALTHHNQHNAHKFMLNHWPHRRGTQLLVFIDSHIPTEPVKENFSNQSRKVLRVIAFRQMP